jgi:oxygen-independent coproporphyrinogen-3 oxidase
MNPVTASQALMSLLKEQGVTRLSIGVQSFSDAVLAVLGRVHKAAEAGQTVSLARRAGFRNIALDLIYAIPGQTEAHWEGTLDSALMLEPEHLSLYSLSLDEGSQFTSDARSGKLIMPCDETAARMYSAACDGLERAGYQRYELSNFARHGFSCRHNLNYWARGEYLGIGAGAWSFVGGVRWANMSDVSEYIERTSRQVSVRSFEERPGLSETVAETLFLGLRTTTGIDMSWFATTFGARSYDSLLAAIEKHHSTGFYEVLEGKLRLTPRGMLLANDAMEALLP